MASLELLCGVAVVAAVAATWWLDQRVLRSGNWWLTWASCVLMAWAVTLVLIMASVHTRDESWLITAWCTVMSGQVVAILLLIGTVVSTVIEWAASSHPQRWRILVVPLVACAAMVCGTVITSWLWTDVPG